MSTGHGVLQSSALANGDRTGEFGAQLDSLSALLASNASPKPKPSDEYRQPTPGAQPDDAHKPVREIAAFGVLTPDRLTPVAPAAAPKKAPMTDESEPSTKKATTPEGAAGSASPKINAKSEGNSKSAPRAEQPNEGNRNVIAMVAIPGQAPVPLPLAVNLPFGRAEDLTGQQPDTSAPSAHAETSASGSATAAPDAPDSSSQHTAEEGMRALKETRTTGFNAPATGELTFAAKVQPAAGASQSSPDSSGRSAVETPAVAAPAIRRSAPDAEGPRTNESTEIPAVVSNVPAMNMSNVPVSNVTTAFQQPNNPAPSPVPVASSPTERTEDPQIPQQTQPSASAGPLKDVSLRIEQPQGQNMEVRVVERAGEVRVAVRGGDSDVIQGLRQNLSELADRLSENGFHAETWRPVASEGSAAPSENKNSSGNSGGGDSQQQSWSQQERGQRDQNQSNRPPWVQEFENSLTSGAAPTGSSNGLTS
jgi:hypothetical protein